MYVCKVDTRPDTVMLCIQTNCEHPPAWSHHLQIIPIIQPILNQMITFSLSNSVEYMTQSMHLHMHKITASTTTHLYATLDYNPLNI